MSIEPNSDPVAHTDDEPLTPMQQAIRARALTTLENDERMPKPSTRRKVITGVLAVVTVVLLFLAIDFAVRILQRVLALYGQDETSVTAPKPFDPNKPFFITVEPSADAPETNAPTSSANTGTAASEAASR
jgi:hypothetical protein